jgi:site-specific DNA-methyltransferase (adenine-specific)
MSYVRTLNTTYEEVELSQLKTHPANPRRGDLDIIKQSISVNGFYGSVVVNRRTSHILAGNHRYLAAKDLGYETVPVTWVDVGDREEKRILAADNRTSELGGYDDAILADLLQELSDADMLEGSGYGDDDLGELLDSVMLEGESQERKPSDESAIGAAYEVWGVQKGQLYQAGEHRLLCGDSTSADDLKRLLGGAQIDLLLTDPPYGVSYSEKNEYLNNLSGASGITKEIANDNLTEEEVGLLWEQCFNLCFLNMKPGANYYISGPQGALMRTLLNQIHGSGFLLKHALIWVKNHAVFGRSDYNYRHEPILYGWKPGAAHYYGGDAKQNSVWEYDKPHASKLHPTMKPIPLFERICINGARRGENVYDPFCGSGTTLLACEGTGRRGFGMELDPEYCSVILQRLSEMGLTPELVEEAE